MGPASKTVIGLDIEPGYVAAVQASPGRVAVERAAYAPLAPGVVRDGEGVDVDTLAGVLRDLFAEHKLGKRVRLGVANQRIVMRTVDLPPLTDPKEIASAVRFQAQDHIPMPLEQAVLEHQTLGPVETADGPRTRIVLVAARREMIDRLLEATTRAGLRPQAIDLSAFAAKKARKEVKALKKILAAAHVAAVRRKVAKARRPARVRKPAPAASIEPVTAVAAPVAPEIIATIEPASTEPKPAES